MNPRDIILYGGSFDPIHLGHLTMAAYAIDYLHAETLIFIPAARSPHKMTVPIASPSQRIEMVRMVIEGMDRYQVSECELNRPQPSYTFDTICEFRLRYGPEAVLYWLVGADAVPELPRWFRIDELLDLCRVCILCRAGFEISSLQTLEGQLSRRHIEQLGRDVIPTPLVDISSSQIRQKIALGQDVRAFLPPRVWEFIRQNQLYGSGTVPVS